MGGGGWVTWKFGTVPSSFIPSFPSSLFLSPSCLAFSNVFLVVCPTAYDLVGIFFVLENHSKQNVIPFFFFFTSNNSCDSQSHTET